MSVSSYPLVSPAYRLVRTLDLRFAERGTLDKFRAEIYQDPDCPTHFRYWVWCLRYAKECLLLFPDENQNDPQWNRAFSAFWFPHLNDDSFVEAADIDAAEAQLHSALRAEFEARASADD